MPAFVIQSVADTPITPNSIYILDIDDTIVIPSNPIKPLDSRTVDWVRNVSQNAYLIYLTARFEAYRALTEQELTSLGFPKARLIMCGMEPKGFVLFKNLGIVKHNMIFYDDLDYNLASVRAMYPQCALYLIRRPRL